MEDLTDVYNDLIMEHSMNSYNKKKLPEADFCEIGHNPNCGDDLTLEVKLDKDDIIEDAAFLGNGCAISSASTAMLIDLIKGKKLEEAKEKVDLFFKMMGQKEKLNSEEMKKLGDAVLMEYVANMPARIKCATLSWHSMKVIIEKKEEK